MLYLILSKHLDNGITNYEDFRLLLLCLRNKPFMLHYTHINCMHMRDDSGINILAQLSLRQRYCSENMVVIYTVWIMVISEACDRMFCKNLHIAYFSRVPTRNLAYLWLKTHCGCMQTQKTLLVVANHLCSVERKFIN